MRYSYRNYFSEVRSLNPELNGTKTFSSLNSFEVFGRFNLMERLQLSVFLPVNFIQQNSRIIKAKSSGLGDMSFLLQYNLLNPLKCTGKKSKHQLRLGIGTKLPGGEFRMNDNDMFNTNVQLGTGSIDFLANAIYTLRFKNFGVNTSAAYKFNTANNKHYRFGDKFTSGVNFFYVFDVKEVQLMPNIGINYEHQFSNRKNGRVLSFTGGDFFSSSIGFDVYYRQFAFSTLFTPALINKLNWAGETKSKFSIETGAFYNFSITKKQANTK